MTIETIVERNEWEQDCQDKWDFDFPILNVNSRIYGVNGGYTVFNNGQFEDYKTHPKKWKNKNASGYASFMFGDKEVLKTEVEAETNEECKKKVEEWIIENYEKALEILVRHS